MWVVRSYPAFAVHPGINFGKCGWPILPQTSSNNNVNQSEMSPNKIRNTSGIPGNTQIRAGKLHQLGPCPLMFGPQWTSQRRLTILFLDCHRVTMAWYLRVCPSRKKCIKLATLLKLFEQMFWASEQFGSGFRTDSLAQSNTPPHFKIGWSLGSAVWASTRWNPGESVAGAGTTEVGCIQPSGLVTQAWAALGPVPEAGAGLHLRQLPRGPTAVLFWDGVEAQNHWEIQTKNQKIRGPAKSPRESKKVLFVSSRFFGFLSEGGGGGT